MIVLHQEDVSGLRKFGGIMRIVAVTSCATGIAHTFIAKERLEKSAQELGISIKVESQGALGIGNRLNEDDISSADVVLIASDFEIKERGRFTGKKVYVIPINKVLRLSKTILYKIIEEHES